MTEPKPCNRPGCGNTYVPAGRRRFCDDPECVKARKANPRAAHPGVNTTGEPWRAVLARVGLALERETAGNAAAVQQAIRAAGEAAKHREVEALRSELVTLAAEAIAWAARQEPLAPTTPAQRVNLPPAKVDAPTASGSMRDAYLERLWQIADLSPADAIERLERIAGVA